MTTNVKVKVTGGAPFLFTINSNILYHKIYFEKEELFPCFLCYHSIFFNYCQESIFPISIKQFEIICAMYVCVRACVRVIYNIYIVHYSIKNREHFRTRSKLRNIQNTVSNFDIENRIKYLYIYIHIHKHIHIQQKIRNTLEHAQNCVTFRTLR